MNRLEIIIGSVMAGKTTELIKRLNRLSDMGLKCIYINHSADTRSSSSYSTHSTLIKKELPFASLKTHDLSSTISLDEYDVIGIDEAQFFDKDLVDFVNSLVDEMKKYVIVAGLDGDFKRQKFGYILDLIPKTDNISKLHAYCKGCMKNKQLVKAIYSYYTGNCNDTIDIGGAEKYQALCRKCYLDNIGCSQSSSSSIDETSSSIS